MSASRSIRRTFLMAIAAVPWLGSAFAQDAGASWKPTRPIRLIVPYPAGGGADVAARVVADKLQKQLGQTVVVDNRGGANGIIGSQAAVTAPADGLTLLVGTIDTQALNPNVYANLPFQPGAFAPVAPIALVPMVFAGSKSGKAQTVRDLIDLAKRGETNYGHYAVGSLPHLASEVFKQQAGIPNMQGIPYQGTGPGSQALMAGQIDMMLLPLTIGLANTERLNVFGLASANRFPSAKQIPTMTEVGFPIDANAWLGIFAPPKTPKSVIEALHKAITAVVNDPDTAKRLLDLGINPQSFPTPDAYSDWVKTEQSRWGKVIQGLGIKLTL